MREERLLSVGIDIGTSTTQCVFSAITLSNTASAFSVPRIQITDKRILYRAPLSLTPLKTQDTIDAEGVERIISREYDAAGIRPEQITISREKTDAAQVEARVYAGMPAGSETLVSVRVGEKLITVKELGSTHYAGDETVYLSYPPKKVNVFDASTKRLIKYSR